MRCTVPRLQQLMKRSPGRAKSISFIGLGRMGSEMALNLFSKTSKEDPDSQFYVCDAIPAAAQAFRDSVQSQFPAIRVGIAHSPEEAVHASQTVVTMLPSSPQVQSVYSGTQGIIAALRSLPDARAKSTVCIDSTTLDVNVAREVSRDVHEAGAMMVDAPVSGGVTGAQAATLSFLVGGTEKEYEAVRTVLSLMGKRIIHCGPSGAGLAAKICNNLVLGVEQIVVAEAMLLGQRLGLKADVLAGVINSSTGGCWASAVNNPVAGALPGSSPPCEREYEGGFATSLMLKDMGLALASARSTGTPTPLGEAAAGIYGSVVESEMGQKDFSVVYSYLKSEQEAGPGMAERGN